MSARNVIWMTVVAALVGGSLAPSAAAQPGERAQHYATNKPTQPPPPPQAETVRPRRGYVWVPGHWDWKGGQYVWVSGHFERERRGKRWREGRWERQGEHWTWTVGAWVDPPAFPVEAPPPPRAETVRPRRGYAWVPGHWDWRNGQYVWVKGHHERRRPGNRWRDARWEQRGGRYELVRGDWEIALPELQGGWVLLGEKEVTGRRDRDVLHVGKRRGAFTRVMLVVEGSDVEIHDVVLHFGNRQTFSPEVRQVFREGSRSRAIDLPGEQRFIKRVMFRYGNLPGGGRAHVQLWALEGDAAAAPRPAPAPAPGTTTGKANFDPTGWKLLGTQDVDGRRDHDVMPVGRKAGAFRQLMVTVEDSDLEMVAIEVEFGNGERFSPRVKHVFREGGRTRAIDLPGEGRFIGAIRIRYGNLPGGGRARVAVWAR